MLVVDTSVLIDHIRGRRAASRLLDDQVDEGVIVPAIAAWELWKGATTPREEAAVATTLDAAIVDPFTPALTRLAGRLHIEEKRRGRERPSLDLMIASHAIHHGCRLATSDRDYAGIEGLVLLRVTGR